MKLNIKVGDFIWHKSYAFMGKVYEVHDGTKFPDGMSRFMMTMLVSDKFIISHLNDIFIKSELEDTPWIGNSDYFVIAEDGTEKTKLSLLLKYSGESDG